MISKEKFVEYMTAIKNAFDKERAFDDAIQALNKDGEGIAMIYSDEITAMTKMVCDLMDIEYNGEKYYGDDIQYFIYECDWGRDKDARLIEYCGNMICLETIEDLYDYIVKYGNMICIIVIK